MAMSLDIDNSTLGAIKHDFKNRQEFMKEGTMLSDIDNNEPATNEHDSLKEIVKEITKRKNAKNEIAKAGTEKLLGEIAVISNNGKQKADIPSIRLQEQQNNMRKNGHADGTASTFDRRVV